MYWLDDIKRLFKYIMLSHTHAHFNIRKGEKKKKAYYGECLKICIKCIKFNTWCFLNISDLHFTLKNKRINVSHGVDVSVLSYHISPVGFLALSHAPGLMFLSAQGHTNRQKELRSEGKDTRRVDVQNTTRPSVQVHYGGRDRLNLTGGM